MTSHVCPHCGKTAYGFPKCPWCNASYSLTEVVQQSKPEELPENITRMQQWRQYIYFLEFVLVAIPATLFEFMTLSLLAGLAGSSPNAALQLFVLWIGGCMGIYALWSMYARLVYNKSVHTLSELP